MKITTLRSVDGFTLYSVIKEHLKDTSVGTKKIEQSLERFLIRTDPSFDNVFDQNVIERIINSAKFTFSDKKFISTFFYELLDHMIRRDVIVSSYKLLAKPIIKNDSSKYIFDGEVAITTDNSYITTYDGIPCSFNDNPAYDSVNLKMWMKDGLKHRDENPAVISGPITEWYIDGGFHRCDGAAVNYNEYKEWWYLGRSYTFNDWLGALSREDLRKALLNPDNF